MILIIHGNDSFQIRDQLTSSVDRYKDRFQINSKDIIDPSNAEKFFKENLSQNSLFKERRIIIVNGLISSKQDFSSIILNHFSKSDDLIIITEEQEINSKKLAKFSKEGAEIKKFQKFNPKDLKTWAQKRISNNGSLIEMVALERLLIFTGNDLWQLSNEIDKLILYKNNKIIELKDIDLLVTSKVEGDIFKAVDCISRQRSAEAFGLIYKHLEKGDSVHYLLSMISFQFRNLLLVKMSRKDMSSAENLSMHPYVFRKTLDQIMSFSENDIKKIYHKILMVDIDIKTGKMTSEVALDLLMAQIS